MCGWPGDFLKVAGQASRSQKRNTGKKCTVKQKTLRLSLPRPVGVSARSWQLDEKLLNNPVRHTPPEKLLCDLLKRQGRRIMADITECPTDTLPAHLARLADWRETVEHHLRHDLLGTPESRRSGAQLAYPATLADLLACAEITRRQHRAPVFLNDRDETLQKIWRGLDQLAGLIASDPAAVEFFAERGQA